MYKTTKEKSTDIFKLLKEAGINKPMISTKQIKKDAIRDIEIYLNLINEEILIDYSNIENGEIIRKSRIKKFTSLIINKIEELKRTN